MDSRTCARLLFCALLFGGSAPASADDFERPPINYSQSLPDNPVSRLQERWDAEQLPPAFEPHFGYLRAVLEGLRVPESSQTLVFSKTSMQRHRIGPETPRALYFNDESYVGFCQAGEVLEISVADPQLGTVFYTLDQRADERPRLVRQTDNCLICHASSATRQTPGHLVRSVFVDAQGLPLLSSGTYRTDHTSPFHQRWGGWYVTGTHGGQRHLGNLIVRAREVTHPVDNAQGQNVADLSGRLAVDRYLTPHSDLVALMVLEHQTMAHNLIAQANFLARQALHHEEALNRELGEPAGHRWEGTTSRLRAAGDPLVECLLFSGEAKLTSPVAGTSAFTTEFGQDAPRDGQGRSLRDFDLQSRLFRYPCSYLIYSDSFAALPPEMRTYVLLRMLEVLRATDARPEFAHLTAADRQAVFEILSETLTDLPAEWQGR